MNPTTTISFDVSIDSFAVSSTIVENDLEKKWFDLAELLLSEDLNKREQKLADFENLLHSDPKFSKFMTPNLLKSRAYLTIYMRAGAWNVTDALAVLNGYYSIGQNYRPYVEMSIPSKLEHVWKEKLNTVLEKRDKFGRRVLIMRLGKWDPDTIPVEHFFASTFVLLETVTKEVKTQIAGLTIVLDIQGFSLKHIRNLGINEIRLAAAFLHGSFPLWIRRIHVLYQPRIFGILMNIAKPFLSENAREVLTLHGSDLTSFYEEVPKDFLPANLGGSGDLDNQAAVGAARRLEDHFHELISLTLSAKN